MQPVLQWYSAQTGAMAPNSRTFFPEPPRRMKCDGILSPLDLHFREDFSNSYKHSQIHFNFMPKVRGSPKIRHAHAAPCTPPSGG